LLRQYFPKGSDFSEIEEQQLDLVVGELNNRPRKGLGYLTPQEAFELAFGGNKSNMHSSTSCV
jgi:IS30 family transposase